MEGSCKGEIINRVNVKHILLDVQDIMVEAFVSAHLNSRKYQGELKDLLEWSVPQKAKRKRKAGGSTKSSAESDSKKTYKENTRNSGTKTKKAGTSAEKASMKAEKAELSLQKRKSKANKEKRKVNTCTLDRYMRRIVSHIII